MTEIKRIVFTSYSRVATVGFVQLPPGMMHLSEAAAVVHERIFWRIGEPTEGLLDAIALALSTRLDIFGFRDYGANLTNLTQDDYAAGTFRCGAARFELVDGCVVRLAVRKTEFASLLDWLVALGLFRTPLTM